MDKGELPVYKLQDEAGNILFTTIVHPDDEILETMSMAKFVTICEKEDDVPRSEIVEVLREIYYAYRGQ